MISEEGRNEAYDKADILPLQLLGLMQGITGRILKCGSLPASIFKLFVLTAPGTN